MIPTQSELPLRQEITRLRSRKDGEEIAVTVELTGSGGSESRTFVISVEQYCSLKPQKGEISPQMCEALETASGLYGALRCGMNLLGYGANSSGTLLSKIMRKGYTKEEAAVAVERLSDMGLLREDEILEREVEKCLRKMWGPRRIEAYLTAKGFRRESMTSLPELFGRADFEAGCRQLVKKHYGTVPTDKSERQKMIAFLFRYGYTYDQIRTVFC